MTGVVTFAALLGAAPLAAQNSPQQPAAASIAAAAPTPAISAAEVQTLRERTAAFWAARVAKDFTKQWELLEPRGRAKLTVEEYAPRGAVKYLGYEVGDATVKGYFATVKVKVIAEAVLPTSPQKNVPPSVVAVEDLWVRIQGTWYHALDQNAAEGR